MTKSASPPTRYATLTGNLPGAIATTVLWGPQAAEILGQLFEPRSNSAPPSWRLNQIYYGHWKWDRPPQDSDSETVSRAMGEDLVICRTDHDCFEIQSHAGYGVQVVASSLSWAGALSCSAAEFHRRPANRWTQQVEQALARATTQRCSLELLRQWWLWQEWGPRLDQLAGRLARESSEVEWVRQSLTWASYAQHLTTPRQVVFCGEPNVGKSSLINACLGYQRSIVDQQPGTTRDVVEQLTAVDGWPVIFSDTAGLRETEAPIESAGIAQARRQIAAADCLVVVIDVNTWENSRCSMEFANHFVEVINRQLGLDRQANIFVVNKMDTAIDLRIPATWIATSALSGRGLSELLVAIGDHLSLGSPPDPLPLPVTVMMEAWLEELAQANSTS